MKLKFLGAAIFVLLISVFATAQNSRFRLVGTGSWTTINATTYSATVTFQSDLTGNGYLPTQIVAEHRLFTGLERVYRIISVTGATFTTAVLTVEEFGLTNGSPSGVVMVYDPISLNTVPNVPFGSTGATAQLQSAIDTYNSRYSKEFRQSNGAPTGAPTGDSPFELAVDTTTAGGNTPYRWNGTVWVAIGGGGGSTADLITMNPAINQNGAGANETTVQGALESIRIYGNYANDVDAAAALVPIGGLYILSTSNTVGQRTGAIVSRQF
jgi:hypothetical protein